ncbi:MAG: AMP-binding protein, partial [Chrysiogenetes bacterium]|nr:AMP-binding protein [Chrysiogenetes bacterium]
SPEFIDVVKEMEPKLESSPTLVCTGPGDLSAHYCTLDSLLQGAKPALPAALSGSVGLPVMPFSGGSTGVPKFVTEAGAKGKNNPRMKGMDAASLKSLQAKLVGGLARLGFWSIPGPIVSMIPGPLYHAGPQTAVLPLFFGSTIVPMRKFDAEEFLKLIEKEKVNYTFVAPTMLERVLKLPDEITNKYDLSSMKVILCAAAPCPDYVKRDINALFKKQGAKGNVFHEYYGSSEAAIITVLTPEDYEANPQRYKSVGKPSGSVCRIYDPDERRWCKPGEVGHVLVRNIRMYRVQYGNSNEMDNAFTEVDGLYWYDDGCLGYFDEDGYLYLTSRSKDMIISGGVNIFPPEIEEVLKTHPNIMDVAVVKVPDEDLGEVPGAIIQSVDGNEIPTDEVIAYCKDKGLYGFKLPKAVKFIEKLPKNDAGKIRKVDLEQVFVES